MAETKLVDIAAERAFLAGLCQYGQDAYIDTNGLVKTETLTDENNQIIYKCIENVLKTSEKVDIASIISSANELGFYEKVKQKTEVDYIRSLFNFPIHKENILVHAKKIVKLEIARKLQCEMRKIFLDLNNITGSETIGEILGLAQKPILDFSNTLGDNEDNPALIGKDLREYVQHLRDNPNTPQGISSGFIRYDRAIGGGFRRKTISLIGARTGVGKSVIADNVAIHVAGRLGIPILMLDTEMAEKDHHNRLLAYCSKTALDIIETGGFAGNPILEKKIGIAVDKIEKMPYTYKNVSGRGFEEILSIIHRWLVRVVGYNKDGAMNDCLVIYDYFKLMNSEDINKNMQEYQAMGFQISNMHNFCVKYDIPVLSFVQLNRDGITDETTGVISQSDRLGWLCNNFSIFKMKTTQETIDDGYEFGNRKLIPVKTRNGPSLDEGNYINMSMQGEFAMLEELRLKSEITKADKQSSGFEIEDEEAPFDDE